MDTSTSEKWFTSKGDYSSGDLKREPKPKLAITGAYAYNDRTFRSRDQLGSFIEHSNGDYASFTTERVFTDVLFKYKGTSFMFEYANRTSDKELIFDNSIPNTVIGTVYNGEAYNYQMGYLFKNNLEIAGRYTNVQPNSNVGNNSEHYTIGLSKYIVGHKLKFQTDLSYIDIAGADDDLVFRMQFELHF